MSSEFGHHLKLSVRGASHAKSMRFELTGFPAGLAVDAAALRAFMERRAPGRDRLSTSRCEADDVILASGVTDGMTDGTVIRGMIMNTDARPLDYGASRTVPRPGHADFPQWVENGFIPTGGGANSGRLTAAFCAAGELCIQWLATRGIRIAAQIDSIGGKRDEESQVRVIERAKEDLDSVGGLVSCSVTGLPPGIGGAMFDGLESGLSAALFAIPGVKGVEFGSGFGCATMRGAEFNDAFAVRDDQVVTTSNRQGGILGGRTNGMPVTFRVAFRPTPTVGLAQDSVDLATMQPAKLTMKGRHDPCIVRRAVPVVEAMTAFSVADALLANEAAHPRICLTLTGSTLDEDYAQFVSQRYFTDMVELRADLLSEEERLHAADFPSRLPEGMPAILTFRRKRDGGAFDGPEWERIAFFRATLAQFAYVDFEDDFHVAELEALAKSAGTRVIRSRHSFDGPVANLRSAARKMVAGTDEIAKIAFTPRSLDDVARMFRASESMADVPHVLCAMGRAGIASRALAGRSGSLWTYASTSGLAEIGHISPAELVRTYRIRAVTRDAALYGVTGWPLVKTLSPEINNEAWATEDEDAIMVPCPASNAKEAIRFMNGMGMEGLAVTIPHKRSVIPLLDALDTSAKAVGAVNTVVRRNGRLVGYNTDVAGFSEALTAFVAKSGRDISSLRAAVLGDGGAAQAVKAALRKLKVRHSVFHRTTPPAGYDILINATPVDPIPDYEFDGHELVYDLRYVPAVTPLMERAASKGCMTENGLTMLEAQAREQRRIWQR